VCPQGHQKKRLAASLQTPLAAATRFVVWGAASVNSLVIGTGFSADNPIEASPQENWAKDV
jgi:hypothetical protein